MIPEYTGYYMLLSWLVMIIGWGVMPLWRLLWEKPWSYQHNGTRIRCTNCIPQNDRFHWEFMGVSSKGVHHGRGCAQVCAVDVQELASSSKGSVLLWTLLCHAAPAACCGDVLCLCTTCAPVDTCQVCERPWSQYFLMRPAVSQFSKVQKKLASAMQHWTRTVLRCMVRHLAVFVFNHH